MINGRKKKENMESLFLVRWIIKKIMEFIPGEIFLMLTYFLNIYPKKF